MDFNEKLRNKSQRQIMFYEIKRNFFSRYFIYRLWHKYIAVAVMISILAYAVYGLEEAYRESFTGKPYVYFHSLPNALIFPFLFIGVGLAVFAFNFEKIKNKLLFNFLLGLGYAVSFSSLFAPIFANSISVYIIKNNLPQYKICHEQPSYLTRDYAHIFILAKTTAGCDKINLSGGRYKAGDLYKYVESMNASYIGIE